MMVSVKYSVGGGFLYIMTKITKVHNGKGKNIFSTHFTQRIRISFDGLQTREKLFLSYF